MKVCLRWFLLIVALFSRSIAAIEVKNLFQTEVIANSQAEKDRSSAIRHALTVVLNRVLADSEENIKNDPIYKSVMVQAPSFVKESQFALVESGNDSGTSARLMRILFDEKLLLDQFKKGQLGIWSEIRPETLMWLVVDQKGSRRFFKPESMPELEFSIHQAATQKGLPVIFPILDLEEREQISVNDVLSAYPGQLLDVSERYDVVSILAGRLIQKSDCWQAEWAFYFDRKITQWVTPCAKLQTTLLNGMDGAYQVLSRYFGVKPLTAKNFRLKLNIAGASNEQDLKRIDTYLQSLPTVISVKWISVQNGFNQYEIEFKGGQNELIRRLEFDLILAEFKIDSNKDETLNFRLIPDNVH